MVGALRALRDANPPTRFITSFALVDGQCVTVLDTGDGEQEKSRVGDPWFADDGRLRYWPVRPSAAMSSRRTITVPG